jgi:hypothetical protein
MGCFSRVLNCKATSSVTVYLVRGILLDDQQSRHCTLPPFLNVPEYMHQNKQLTSGGISLTDATLKKQTKAT